MPHKSTMPPGAVAFLTAAAMISAILFGFVLRATSGAFGFSMDDPYINLALAQRIVDGHYGLNLNEAAAPSSSILYPFLLAALLKLGLGQGAALLVNLAATAASMVLLAAIAAEANIDLTSAGMARLFAVALVALLGLNVIGLAFTGLEHAPHVADTLACLLGVVRSLRTGRVPRWLPVVLVLNPLIRFEGLSVWGAGIVVLWLEKKVVEAYLTLLVGTVLVGSFCWYLHHLGLPPLPSSVMVKSQIAHSTSVASALIGAKSTLLDNLLHYGAPQLLLALALLIPGLSGDHVARGITLFAGLPILAHLLGGAFNWSGRYEAYILVLAWTAVAVMYANVVTRWFVSAWPSFAAGLLLWLGMHAGYARITLLTPRATAEIYLQQYQMHRFAVEFWRAPVAVNDLGWVAYGNPNYVLDLRGLGSETARIAIMKWGPDPSWMDQLVRRYHVGLAMIYTSWFPAVPADWTPIATLTLDRYGVSAALPTVTFYATTPLAIPVLQDALARFAPTVPVGAHLVRQVE